MEPTIQEVVTPWQNWTHEESIDFYNAPQGSQLIPYRWYLHLEVPEAATPFRDAAHIRQLGYLPRLKDPSTNPDGLPIGFVKDRSFPDGEVALGLSCAACHTTRIDFGGRAYLIDGAPALGDFAALQRRLVESLRATLDQADKFDRFAVALGEVGATDRLLLRESMEKYLKLRTGYNERNLPGPGKPEPGHGRVDAFGAILNEVSGRFLDRPQNVRPADAPVSYPFIWDGPQHDAVQWNGSVKNDVLTIASPILGTRHVGALGRNAGEVLGVFGSVDVTRPSILTGAYSSSVDRQSLIDLEESLTTLWSPQWPKGFNGFPAIDTAASDRGREHYRQRCGSCHTQPGEFKRDDSQRTIVAKMVSVRTDDTMARNFLSRTVATGPLQGRRRNLTSLIDWLQPNEPGAEVLRHVVSRVLIGTTPSDAPRSDAAVRRAAARSSLEASPFSSEADLVDFAIAVPLEIETDDAILQGTFAAVQFDENGAVTGLLAEPGVTAVAKADLATPLRLSTGAAPSFLGPQSQEAFLSDVTAAPVGETTDARNAAGEALVFLRVANARISYRYKARPLNGIWATAPYLHNGSVPNLAELLKPAQASVPSGQRSREFFVGNREFDPVNVGFVSTSGPFKFDTTLKGNSNAGHEFGSDLSETDRHDLIEYLKSL